MLPPPKRAIDIDLAALIYTSGSTGNPKGVMLTHLNMVSAATSITTYLENTPDDIILNVLPLSFDYGLYQVLMAVKIGGTVVLERSFAYPQAVIRKLIEERVTGFPLVPTMSAILLQMDLSEIRLVQLRYITNTAAALPTEHILQLRKLFPHVRIYSMYGLTECKRVSYLPPEQLDLRPGSVGRGMPNEEVYVVDEQGSRVGPGVVGELVVRGANVMKGYWELPEETAPPPEARARCPAKACSTPATCSAPTRKDTCTSWAARTTSSRAAARRSARGRSKTCCSAIPRLPRRRWSACPTRSWARRSSAVVSLQERAAG